MFGSSPKAVAKHADGVLRAVVLGRVSTLKQDKENIEAGYKYAESILKHIWEGAVDVRRFGEQISGLVPDRDSMEEAWELISSGWADLVLMEDSSKSSRNPKNILKFVQDCVDLDVRVIAPGDGLDTADENWELMLGVAALRHGIHIPDTRRRVRRTASFTFEKGGMVLRVRFGYRKLTEEEADSGKFGPVGLRLTKVEEHTHIIETLRRKIVIERKGGEALVEWIKSQDPPIPPPPYAKEWNARVLLDLLRDPILYGLRQFPKVQYRALFGGTERADRKPRQGKKTVQFKRNKNPQPQEVLCPTLAHMTKQQWLEMNAVLDEIGARNKRTSGSHHPRHRVARHKSYCGLQHTTCVACKDFLYTAGKDCIKCQNAIKRRNRKCWNHVQVDLPLLRQTVVDLCLSVMNRHPAAQQAFLESAWEGLRMRQGRGQSEIRQANREIATYQGQAERLAKAISLGGNLPVLVKTLAEANKQLKAAMKRRKQLMENQDQTMPMSLEDFRVDPREALLKLANTSFEFANLMRRIIPQLVIQPVQALDSGQVRPRALIALDLSVLLPPDHVGERPEVQSFEIDLFQPPEHIRHLNDVVKLKEVKQAAGQKASLTILADELRINRMTVKRALGYYKLMQAEGLSTPYRVLSAAPISGSRWKPRSKPVLERRTAEDEPKAA